MIRRNPDLTEAPLTLPNDDRIKSPTLRSICARATFSRGKLLKAWEQA